MVLCIGKRGSRVRCAPRQRRPVRAARAAGRRTRSLPDSLHDTLHDFRKGKLARFSAQKNINNTKTDPKPFVAVQSAESLLMAKPSHTAAA
jgi:hypothetical protein